MAGGGSVVIIGSNSRNSNDGARVTNNRLWVDAIASGGTQNVNIVSVGGNAVTNAVPVEIIVSKQILSGSTNGRPIAVAATASPGTLIHRIPDGEKHQIFMVASNRTSVGRDLIVEWGGTALSDEMKDIIPPLAQRIFSNGAIIEASGSDIDILAWSPIANIININGHVIEL